MSFLNLKAGSIEFPRLSDSQTLSMIKKVRVLSHESLSGNIISAEGSIICAQRLAEHFRNSKIVMVLPHPVDYVVSAYSYSIKSGSQQTSFETFLESGAIIRKLNYRALISVYQQLSGSENFLVLPYELLRVDSAAFLRRLTGFIGVPEFTLPEIDNRHLNRSYSALRTVFLNKVNFLDKFMAKYCRTPKRFFNKAMRRLLEQPLMLRRDQAKPRLSVDLEGIKSYNPVMAEMLNDDEYELWDGDLREFNDKFQ